MGNIGFNVSKKIEINECYWEHCTHVGQNTDLSEDLTNGGTVTVDSPNHLFKIDTGIANGNYAIRNFKPYVGQGYGDVVFNFIKGLKTVNGDITAYADLGLKIVPTNPNYNLTNLAIFRITSTNQYYAISCDAGYNATITPVQSFPAMNLFTIILKWNIVQFLVNGLVVCEHSDYRAIPSSSELHACSGIFMETGNAADSMYLDVDYMALKQYHMW